MDISASSLMQEMQALKIEAGATPLAQPGREVTSDFGQLLQQALGNVNELQGAANDLRTRFDMGDKSVDLSDVMIAGRSLDPHALGLYAEALFLAQLKSRLLGVALLQVDGLGRRYTLPRQHLLDITLGVDPSLVLIAQDGMAHVFDYDPLVAEIDRLARDGFTVSPRLAGMINGRSPQARTRWASAYFTKPDGTRYQAGDTLKNPAYADTVARLAQQGPGVVYGGPIGRDIAAAVREGPRPGGLTEADIAGYRPLRRDALCRPYQAYVVCVPPPPSSGVALLTSRAILIATSLFRCTTGVTSSFRPTSR